MSLFRSRNGGGAGNASAARWAFSVRASAPLDHCGSSPPPGRRSMPPRRGAPDLSVL